MFIGGLGQNLVTSKYLLASTSYHHSVFTWCVKKAEPIPVRENLLHLCQDPKVYAVFTFSAFSVLAAAYFVQQFEPRPAWDWHRIFVEGFGAVLGFSTNYRAKNNANRVLFACFLLASTLFVIVINSVALSFITTPILKPQIKTVDEIIRKEFSLVGDRLVLMKLLGKTEVNELIKFLRLNH